MSVNQEILRARSAYSRKRVRREKTEFFSSRQGSPLRALIADLLISDRYLGRSQLRKLD